MKYAVYECNFLEEVFSSLAMAIDYAEQCCNNVYNTTIVVYGEDELIIEYLRGDE